MNIPVSAATLEKMLSNIGDVIVIIDRDGNTRYKSPNCEKLFGWKPEELVGKPAWINVHQDDTEEIVRYFNELVHAPNESTKLEFRYCCKNGDVKWVEFSATNLLNDKEVEAILGNYHDITERKVVEDAVQASEIRLRSLFQNLNSSSSLYEVIVDQKGMPVDYEFLAVNPAYEKSIGIKEEELVGKRLLEVFPSTEKVWIDALNSVYLSGEAIHLENYSQAIDRYFELTVYRPMANQIAMIGSDITDRKRNEIEIIKAKEMAEEGDRLKSAFLQNMSHEIRTPLNAICGFSNLLLRPNVDLEKVKYFVTVINNSSDQLLAIVNDILTISSIETKQEKVSIANFNVNELLDELADIFRQQLSRKGVSIHTNCDFTQEQAMVQTDKTKLTQILSNLISNAIKFTCEGQVKFGYTRKKNMLEFFVKDSGIGIHPNKHKSIFKRFSQADQSITNKYGGSGLGLAISKGFTELLGGTIWVESVPGEGATFLFNIPYKAGKPITQSSRIGEGTSKNRALKILVAEDEKLNMLFFKELFRLTNNQLVSAHDGQEAVDLFKKEPDIDLILMDIKMPNLDGYAAAGIIKELNPKVPIIAQTAYALESEVKKFEDVFDGYVTKPIAATTLMNIIEKYT